MINTIETLDKIDPFDELDSFLKTFEILVKTIQEDPLNYPNPKKEFLDANMRKVDLTENMGYYLNMSPELIKTLYPTSFLHKVYICKEAALGKEQYVLILGAQTAERDFLYPAKWVSEMIDKKKLQIMKNNLFIHCVDILEPPIDNIWEPFRIISDSKIKILNTNYAKGIYETISIENILQRILENFNNYSFLENKIHIIAEGSTDYLSKETLKILLTLFLNKLVKSFTLRTIIPSSAAQFITAKKENDIFTSLIKDLKNLKIKYSIDSESSKKLVFEKEVEKILNNIWQMKYSAKQLKLKGLDSNYQGNHLRPQDLVKLYRKFGFKVQYNLFSTACGYPNGASIVISK